MKLASCTTGKAILLSICCTLLLSVSGNAQIGWHASTTVVPATDSSGKAISPAQAAVNSALATFQYTVVSTRDGNTYSGAMVGQDPFGSGLTTTTIATPVIPVILTTSAVATAISGGFVVNTKPGTTVFDPTSADDSCLKKPNDVPLAVFNQSPIFQSSKFTFGTTTVGTTQYVDAFQRGNFWNSVAGTNYHTILNPQILAPITLKVSGDQGLSLPGNFFGGCGPLAIVNFTYVLQQVFPSLLASVGVNSSQFPILLFYNTVLSGSSPSDLNDCCVLGFHEAFSQNAGSPVQTYAFIDFHTAGGFGPSVHDASVASHEVGEWMDDPFGNNPTPAWGHVGQVSGCQNNLEVGDPLSGSNVPTVKGANGFTYHLQELAFFSWFYGAPSISVNGWFSDNNTFKGDAGPVCSTH